MTDLANLTIAFTLVQSDEGAHLIMNGERQHEHNTDGLDCWCSPAYNLVCDECDIEDHRGAAQGHLPTQPSVPSCWKCRNGLIPVSRAEAEWDTRPLIIVHNR